MTLYVIIIIKDYTESSKVGDVEERGILKILILTRLILKVIWKPKIQFLIVICYKV